MDKMEEIKYKVLDLINKKKDVKIPKMGFTDYYVQHQQQTPKPSKHSSVPGSSRSAAGGGSSSGRNSAASSSLFDYFPFDEDDDDEEFLAKRGQDETDGNCHRLSDQEVLESTEAIYFDAGSNTGLHELTKLSETDQLLNCSCIEQVMTTLRQQHKVISKKVLQLILEQRPACQQEFLRIQETENLLRQTLTACRTTRTHLDGSKQLLTATNLQILAAYKKRQTLIQLLKILTTLKSMRSIDQRLQKRLTEADYGGAIAILLENKNLSERFQQFHCVESLSTKLQDTLIMSEVQLEAVLNEVPNGFDAKRYAKLQEAYKLLEKQLIAMDQLHMNFISSIHTAAFTVLKQHSETIMLLDDGNSKQQKLTFEQMCENVPSEKYIHCMTDLCRAFWKILVSYYQVRCWHQNQKLYEKGQQAQQQQRKESTTSTTTTVPTTASDSKEQGATFHEEYIQQKLDMGQFRLWNDIQAKIGIFISSTRLSSLKYEYFIQILAIVQRLKKVGIEFCDDPSEKLMEHMQRQSADFFRRYHGSCLEEIGLFFDHEVWVPIGSFTDVSQLQEYKNFKHALVKGQNGIVKGATSKEQKQLDALGMAASGGSRAQVTSCSSVHSQDESSLYGSCGYFLRFTEKSSPFDGGFDCTMLEEDILAGIADESSYYYSEDSSDNNENYFPGQSPEKKKPSREHEKPSAPVQSSMPPTNGLTVTNTSLTVLRCIGRYLYFCKLLHSIAPHIVRSMTELIDFYLYAVHEIFSRDLPVPRDNLYTPLLRKTLDKIQSNLISKLRKWPLSDEMIADDLANPDLAYGLQKRIIATESCVGLIAQFRLMEEYLNGLLQPDPVAQAELRSYLNEIGECATHVRKPLYMCVTARIVDLQIVLHGMGKVKWDINHINAQHSSYVDTINRGVQHFAMRLEEITKQQMTPSIPKETLWDCFAHVITHLLVEGFSNAKKCTPAGRALMQLDFTHFISILEMISGGRYPEHRGYVEQYIKAFYLPRDLLEQWLPEGFNVHGYSVKHLTGLVQCACSSDKKLRQRLLAMLENGSIIASAGDSYVATADGCNNDRSAAPTPSDLNKESSSA
ncbi:syndetin [Uranotaenia lowii]|uniref:syndetin n=1 Tax=Uranotaenia lowii TaxID=190385 RepID=UPI0024793B96|nr:syndetin [Uranotaenia lowii]